MGTSLYKQSIATMQLFVDAIPQLTAFTDTSDSNKFMEWADSQRQAQQSILAIFKSPLWLHATQYRDLEHRIRGKMSVYFGSVNEIRHKPESFKSE
ncbi:hypothetical protein KAZ93_02775 [Patescibacteria group bacterium]|nr:hypothetical protein [Patescibacteria group bacterium]